jgi:predicted Fe-Mo cluster-binding NifX family protein
MLIAVSSMGSSLDAWTGIGFSSCDQFLVVDDQTMEFIVVSVPSSQQLSGTVNLHAIRAIAKQGAQTVITGPVKDVCRQTMQSLGMDVIDNVGRMTVRQAVEQYAAGGESAVREYVAPPEKIAVASHGDTLEAPISSQDEPCTSFVLVDARTMEFEVVGVAPAESLVQSSVNAVRAAAKAGATVVITPGLQPACCYALNALAIRAVVAKPGATVRQAIAQFKRGELSEPPIPRLVPQPGGHVYEARRVDPGRTLSAPGG